MIEPLLDLYDGNLAYARKLVADIPDEKMAAQPAPGMNHAAWVIGHLARTSDFTLVQLGGEEQLPPGWSEVYGIQSKPEPDRSRYASKEELVAALERGHERVREALRKVDDATLDAPPALERIRGRFPTLRHFVIYVLVGHEQMHLGQLSAWRRVQGYPPVQ